MAKFQRSQNDTARAGVEGRAKVQFQRTPVNPGSVAPVASTMGALSQAMGGFFTGAQAALQGLGHADLIAEYSKVERENKDLAIAGTVSAQRGEAPDPTKVQRNSYADAYHGALGGSMWQKDASTLQGAIDKLGPSDDPRAAAEQFINGQIKGAEPRVELAYRKHAADFAAGAIFKWESRAREDAVGAAMQNVTSSIAADLSSGNMPTPEWFKGRVQALADVLPVGKKDQAHAAVLTSVLRQASASDNGFVSQFFDMKQEDGRSLRETYPAEIANVERERMGRSNSVRSMAALNDLNTVETGFKTGMMKPVDALNTLVAHRARFGESNPWRDLTVGAIVALQKDATKASIVERALAFSERQPGVNPLTSKEMNEVGPQLISSIYQREVSSGRTPEEAWARVGGVLAANNSLPAEFAQQTEAEMLSSDPARVVAAYGKLRVLQASFGDNPEMFTKLAGNSGLVRYMVMDAEVKSGASPADAAARAAAVTFNSPTDLEKLQLGDGKPATVEVWNAGVRSHLEKLDKSMDLWIGRSGATGEVEQMIRDRLKVGVALFGQLGRGTDQQAITEWAARSVRADIQPAFENGTLIWVKRVMPQHIEVDGHKVPSRGLDGNDISAAAAEFGKLSTAFGSQGAKLTGLRPRADGRGYDAFATSDDGIRRSVVFLAGQRIGNMEVPVDIPSYGHVPEQLRGTGFALVPTGRVVPERRVDDNAEFFTVLRPEVGLMYVGETASEKALRTEQSNADTLKGAVLDARAKQDAAAPPAELNGGVLSEFQARSRATGLAGVKPGDRSIIGNADERRKTSVGYHMDRMLQSIAEKGVDNGLLSADWLSRVGPPRINSVEDARAFLDKLMTDARQSVRFTPFSGVAGSETYRNQRLDVIHKREGYREYAYDDASGKPAGAGAVTGSVTVGYGFNMERKDAPEVFAKALGLDQDAFAKVKAGGKPLTKEQGIKLAEYTLNQVEDFLEKRVGKGTIDALSTNQRLALVSLAYHGPGLVSTELVTAIKAKDYSAAADLIGTMSKRAKDLTEDQWRRRRVEEAEQFRGLDGHTPRGPNRATPSASLGVRG